jgi:hypothetical protein
MSTNIVLVIWQTQPDRHYRLSEDNIAAVFKVYIEDETNMIV